MITARIREQLKGKIPFFKTQTGGFEEIAAIHLRKISQEDTNDTLQLLESNLNGLSAEQVAEKNTKYGR